MFQRTKRKYETVMPSIDRDGLLENEDKLFKEFIIRNPDEFKGQRSTFEILTKMQHYGLPTRLLDITTNPLVALFLLWNLMKNRIRTRRLHNLRDTRQIYKIL
ncbi:FRG domain-containing protein [Pseudomonas aeruginosa]|nr:FRG domain-containing protein [Pseudomonas aeruginosa]